MTSCLSFVQNFYYKLMLKIYIINVFNFADMIANVFKNFKHFEMLESFYATELITYTMLNFGLLIVRNDLHVRQ